MITTIKPKIIFVVFGGQKIQSFKNSNLLPVLQGINLKLTVEDFFN